MYTENKKPAVGANGQYSTNGSYTTSVASENQPACEQELVNTKPADFKDLNALNGMEAVKAQLMNTKVVPLKPVLPSGFFIGKDGLYYEEEWICSPLEVLTHTRDEHNENWGILVRFKDRDGYVHEKAIPMEILKGDYQELYGLLLSLGLRITPKKVIRNKLPEYLQKVELSKRALCTSRIGWYGNHFILPDGAIPETDTIYLQSDNSNFAGYQVAGRLAQWQEHVAKLCQGNSRLVFALSCAFAGPLMSLLKAESGGFNLIGSSSIGKSTALAVAASVWGSPKYIHTWKATSNALEAVAEAHNNTLLCLDELGQVNGLEVGEIVYMLANGSGKNRLKAKGGLRRKYEWNLLFLSTGEVSIADKLNEVGKTVQAGMLTRMVDIPADAEKGHGLFDTVHNFKDGNAIAQHLKVSTSQYHGIAIGAYLPCLIDTKDILPRTVTDMEKLFLSRYVQDHADGQVIRVAKRFSLVATGGELAIKCGILPYATGEALEAAGMCFISWLESRGGTGSHEIAAGISQIKAFIETHHSSRFALMGDDDADMLEQKIINQAGYRRKTSEWSWEYFIFAGTFTKEICKSFDYKIICRELKRKGHLSTDKEEGRFTKTQRLPTGSKKVYHLGADFFTSDEKNDGNTGNTGNSSINTAIADDLKHPNNVTTYSIPAGNSGNTIGNLLPVLPPVNSDVVTSKTNSMAVLPPVTSVTTKNIEVEDNQCMDEERAAILEFDGGLEHKEPS
jgi:putative DNA primase/helicase